MTVTRMGERGRRAATAVLWIAVAGALVLALGTRLGWWLPLEVRGGSMQPTIPNGALVVTTPRDVHQVAVGDVVSFVGDDGKRVTHRVVDVDAFTGAVTTRGDANVVDDATPYAGPQVDVVRFSVPGLGVTWRAAAALVRNPLMLAGLAVALLVLAPRRARSGRHAHDDRAVTA
ncbi:signal peptidase I [Cellulomonas sp. HD19AZ1]|uniref:signal peptidase I n=1 Tax=Cellulomonas sp. HD19AZ1 TaxID=2559593 RepID=UPI001070CCF4|nr:signal peptidase I [Cellulomonas sp. HD19AZ1]TFH68121.1 signal peptidase I [Cellulomonas sp. HD19AZ1]